MRGKVKWFNETKGFGFIQPENGGKDVFVHASSLQKSNVNHLSEGQTVEFELQSGKKGDEAVHIKVVL